MYSLSSWYSWSWMFEFSTHNKRRTERTNFFSGAQQQQQEKKLKVDSSSSSLNNVGQTNRQKSKVDMKMSKMRAGRDWICKIWSLFFSLSFLFLHLCPHKLPHNTPEPTPRCRRHGKFVGNLQLVCYNFWVFSFSENVDENYMSLGGK